jgi:hypothetical protein
MTIERKMKSGKRKRKRKDEKLFYGLENIRLKNLFIAKSIVLSMTNIGNEEKEIACCTCRS